MFIRESTLTFFVDCSVWAFLSNFYQFLAILRLCPEGIVVVLLKTDHVYSYLSLTTC